MTDKLSPRYADRDFHVLREIVRLIDETIVGRNSPVKPCATTCSWVLARGDSSIRWSGRACASP